MTRLAGEAFTTAGDLVRRCQDVFHVVEDEDHRAVGDERQHGRGGRPVGAVEDADPVSDRRPHLVGAVQGGQADEPRAVREPRFEHASSLDREAGLADPARTGERHQSGVLGQLHEIAEFLVASDERGQPIRQVAETLRR